MTKNRSCLGWGDSLVSKTNVLKAREPEFKPLNPCEKADVGLHTHNPSTGEVETRDPWDSWPASLVYQQTPGQWATLTRNDIQSYLLAPQCMHTHVHPCTHVHLSAQQHECTHTHTWKKRNQFKQNRVWNKGEDSSPILFRERQH